MAMVDRCHLETEALVLIGQLGGAGQRCFRRLLTGWSSLRRSISPQLQSLHRATLLPRRLHPPPLRSSGAAAPQPASFRSTWKRHLLPSCPTASASIRYDYQMISVKSRVATGSETSESEQPPVSPLISSCSKRSDSGQCTRTHNQRFDCSRFRIRTCRAVGPQPKADRPLRHALTSWTFRAEACR